MSSEKTETFNNRQDALSARETADVLDSLIRLLNHSDLRSDRTLDALSHVVRTLRRFGDHPIASFRVVPSSKTSRSRAVQDRGAYKNITLDEVEKVISDQKTTRSQIANLALERFGIPQSRLNRGRIDEAIDIVRAAINHERSIDLISARADVTGQERKS